MVGVDAWVVVGGADIGGEVSVDSSLCIVLEEAVG